SKGKKIDKNNDADSDIDTSLFVDADKLKETQDDITHTPEFLGIMQDVQGNTQYNTEGMTDEQREQFLTQIGIEKFIVQKAQAKLSQLLGPRMPHVAMYVNFISAKGDTSMYDSLARHQEITDEEKLRRPDIKWSFRNAHFFMLDVGGGLKDYRKAFFDRLSQDSSARADDLWKVADKNIRGWERIGPVPPELEPYFPSTYSQAKAYYADGGPTIEASGQLITPNTLVK
ncbi:hypothetical protein HYS00_05285, partial [Candidatus Microgenomates bacterium]|nr:hypothetical protein [Candidatus Microgenomates bacterium]